MNTMSRLMSAAREMRTAQTVEERPRLDSAHHRNKWLRRFYTGYTPLSNEQLVSQYNAFRGRRFMLMAREHIPRQGIREAARRWARAAYKEAANGRP